MSIQAGAYSEGLRAGRAEMEGKLVHDRTDIAAHEINMALWNLATARGWLTQTYYPNPACPPTLLSGQQMTGGREYVDLCQRIMEDVQDLLNQVRGVRDSFDPKKGD